MQIFGKIGNIRGVPFYLGHKAGDPHHVNIVCDETGHAYTEMDMLRAKISLKEVSQFLSDNLEVVAPLLKRPIDRVGVYSRPGNISHIIDVKVD